MYMYDNFIEILIAIKNILCKLNSQKKKFHSLFESNEFFCANCQANSVVVESYHEIFNKNVKIIEYFGGLIGKDQANCSEAIDILGHDEDISTPEYIKDAQETKKEMYLATAFTLCTERHGYRKLIKDIQNGNSIG